MKILHTASPTSVAVDDRDFKRFLRFPPGRAFEGAVAENAAWARSWYAANGRPWVMAMKVESELQPLVLHRWPKMPGLGLIIVSAGPEAEKTASDHWEADEPDRYYFLECFAAAVVDRLLVDTREAAGASQHYCPGFPDWGIEANGPLLDALRSRITLPGPLEAMPSGMLLPKKSQLAVFPLAAA